MLRVWGFEVSILGLGVWEFRVRGLELKVLGALGF